jgi:hypothetical protein
MSGMRRRIVAGVAIAALVVLGAACEVDPDAIDDDPADDPMQDLPDDPDDE